MGPRIRAAVHRHAGLPRDEIEEVEDEAMVLFWEAIGQESFFEVRFNLAMKRLVQQAARRIRGGKQRARERAAVRIGPLDSELSDGRDAWADVAADADISSEVADRMLIETGLATLPREQARALSLQYLIGLPVHSQDPAVRTVSSTLGCGERKARQLITDGKARIRRWFDGEDGDE